MSQPQNPWHPADTVKPTLVSSMAIATELWLVVVVCQAIAYIGQYSTAAESVRDTARTSKLSQDDLDLMNSTGLVVGVFVATGVVVAAVSLLIVWFARTGRNWARMVLTFFSAFLVVQAILSLFGGSGPQWTTVPTVIGGVAAFGAVYLLLQKDTETYCKAMATYRKSGGASHNGPYPQPQYPQPQYPQSQYPQAPYPQSQYPQAPYPQSQYTQQPYPYQGQPYHPQGYPQQGPAPQGYPQPDSPGGRDDRPDSDVERGNR